MKVLGAMFVTLLCVACTPFVPVVNLKQVPQSDLAASMDIQIYTIDSSASHPPIEKVLGDITSYSCKFLPTDPPASKGDALKQLRYKAWQLHANAIVDVTFDTRGMDAFGTNCYESVQASGQAVLLRATNK